jgi:NodT family efflux transporter outer membrane factor (OMF) lipoprotein
MKMRAILVLGAALLAGGCSVGDAYQRPDAAKPPAAWKNTATPAQWPSADWWKGFGSLRLDDLQRMAAEGNFDLRVAAAKVRQADAQLAILGAALLPSLSGTAGASRSRASQTASTASNSKISKPAYANSFNMGLSASYEVDFWGKNTAAVDSAAQLAQASRFDQQTVMLSTQSAVATTYFDILGLTERLRVARGAVANAQNVLDAINDRFRAGTASSLDVAQQESVLAAQKATIAPIEQQLRQDFNALAILTGRLPEAMALVPETLDELTIPAPGPGLPSELLNRRPDIQSAEASLRAANADVAAAKAAWFPSISLTAQTGFQSVDLFKMANHLALLGSVAASLTQPIFDGGKIEGTIEQKEARYDELAQTYLKAVASAFADVENALIGLEQTTLEVAAQRESEATARRAFEISQSLMSAGTVDITTVLNTQKTLFSAQDAVAQARLQQLQAVVGLYKAMGGGWALIGGQSGSGQQYRE